MFDQIVDDFTGNYDDEDSSEEQEQALNTAITLQDDASNIANDLFSSGMDTLAVIDSIATFFSNDTSIQDVWADSEGVAVEYKNGIAGGIFIGRYNKPIKQIGKSNSKVISSQLSKGLLGEAQEPKIKKSIYFDGAYSSEDFKKYNDKNINAANEGFSKIGVAPFDKYLDNNATIEVLSSLDQYGYIHLTGHGWHRYSGNGFYKDKKETYFLTGEKPQLNKTYGELWDDILNKKIVIISHENENRYWVSSNFVAERNNFSGNNTFIYNAFCYGFRENWQNELIQNSGASALVGYYWAVWANFESEWAIKMYNAMSDTAQSEPEKIGSCVQNITNGNRGYYDVGDWDPFIIKMNHSGDTDLTFWEPEPPLEFSSIRFEYVLDTYWNPSCYPANYQEFDQFALLVSDIVLTVNKTGNSYSGSWDAFYSWGERWHTGSISFTLNEDKTKATSLTMKFADVSGVTNQIVDEYNIKLSDIDCNYSDDSLSLFIKNQPTCSHIDQFDYWYGCGYPNEGLISQISNVTCSQSETAATYYFIQIDLAK